MLSTMKKELEKLEQEVALYIKTLEESLSTREISEEMLKMDLKEFDNRVIRFLALYQPRGELLREIIAYLKIVPFINKIKKSIRSYLKKRQKYQIENPTIEKLYQNSVEALRSLKMGILAGDIEEVFPVILEYERSADKLYSQLVREVKEMEDIEEGLRLLNLAKKLERITDSVKTIGFYLLFAQEGI
jgi:phosphate transport system protein